MWIIDQPDTTALCISSLPLRYIGLQASWGSLKTSDVHHNHNEVVLMEDVLNLVTSEEE